ncbi:MAG: AMIN domain-containing protein [Bryobacterales bacterium]|nr:AMIN domain-containing protein [Bryobacterales bacterium]
MIRINLLEVRPQAGERLRSLLGGRASSTFISRRETLAGVAFLALTAGILTVVATRLGWDEESAEAVTVASSPAAADLEVEPIVVDTPELAPPTPFREASLQASLEAQLAEPAPQPETRPRTPAATAPEPAVEVTKPAPKPEPKSSPAPAGKKFDVSAVRATPLADRLDVFVEVAGSPKVSSFRVDNPPRLVFDLAGAQLALSNQQRTQSIASPLAGKLRIAQFQIEPAVVRLVLELGGGPAKAAVSTSPAGVSIVVTPAP